MGAIALELGNKTTLPVQIHLRRLVGIVRSPVRSPVAEAAGLRQMPGAQKV